VEGNDTATTATTRGEPIVSQRQRPEAVGGEERERDERVGERCPECDGRIRVDDRHGERACRECGLVVATDGVDHGPEWRSFDDDRGGSRSRVGAPVTRTIHEKGLSTQIDWRDRDHQGRTLDARARERFRRLRTWDERFRTRDSQDRNLKQALGEIDRMASALGLPENVRETASVLYRRALEEDLLPGRSIEGIATGCLYAASRQAGHPRSVDDVAAASRVDELEFQRTYRYVVRELDLRIEPVTPTAYLPQIASELGVRDETERRARALLETGIEAGVHSGKNPVGLAAAALYAAAGLTGEKVTQTEVSGVANMSEVTIRNRYRELLECGG
jgi:transcription initiation factor TFIIB